MPDRVFTEEEVREIVRRASEQQAEDAERREAQRHGLTLDDLERLGAEVGLDPAYLRRAADEVRTGRRAVTETETKTDTHVIVERRIDRPFSLEAWEDTVVMLRQNFGVSAGMWTGGSGDGRVEQVGRAHEWVHMSQLGVETRVSVSDRDGQTRLLLSQRVGQAKPKIEGIGYGLALGVMAGLVGGMGTASLLGDKGLFFLGFLAIFLITTLLAAPVITRLDERWRDKKQKKLKELAADIERIFADAAPVEAPAAEAERSHERAQAAPHLDLDGLPDESEAEAQASRTRTRS